ncbi:N-acetylmuramoyl-L-alanine amidase [Ornithinibacillus salinisoli]
MKKIISRSLVTGFLLTIFFFVPTIIANAEESGQLFEVDITLLNMRTDPSHESQIIGQLEDGDRLRVFEEENGWVKTFFDGKPVWVAASYLIFIEEKPKNEESPPEENTNEDDTNSSKNTDNEDGNNNENNNNESENEDNEKEETDTSSEQKSMEDYFRISDFIGSKPLFADTPDEQTDDQPDEQFKTMEPKEEKISKNAIEITDELLQDYHIVIDPGHGGNDSGATSKGLLEKTLTLATAEKVAEHLEHAGANVQLTREEDKYISLDERIYTSNSQDTDAYISLHFDSYNDTSVNGVNTYYYHENTSLDLAKVIHSKLIKSTDMNDRGIRKTGFLVLRENDNPAVLLELGFMTNPENLEIIQTENYQNKVAEAITDGLIEYFDEE